MEKHCQCFNVHQCKHQVMYLENAFPDEHNAKFTHKSTKFKYANGLSIQVTIYTFKPNQQLINKYLLSNSNN